MVASLHGDARDVLLSQVGECGCCAGNRLSAAKQLCSIMTLHQVRAQANSRMVIDFCTWTP